MEAPHATVVVLVTVPDGDAGERIAGTVVEERLAACVSVLPAMRSVFAWQGRVEVEAERLLVIKTSAGRLGALEARIRALHPYTVPEFLALPVAAGHRPYLEWVAESVGAKGGGEADEERSG